jgi:hypothetical protein
MSRIAVVGGGPAGFMAAVTAASGSAGAETVVLEAGVPLAKLLRTGGGRCNLANATFDNRELAAQYPRGGEFLRSAFDRIGAWDAMEWFRSRGLALVVEDEGRVFPRSGRAGDVRDLLEREARSLGVRVRARAPVTGIRRDGPGFEVGTPRGAERYDRVIIATGGDWRNRAGSGYRLAGSLGHSITRLAPSLAGLVTAESWPASLAGLALRGARLEARHEGRKVAEELGDLLFTHSGISGPLAFRVSSRCAFLPFSPDTPLRLHLSALPDMGPGEIEARLLEAISARPRQTVASALRALVPRPLAAAAIVQAGVDAGLTCSQLLRAGRRSLAGVLHRFPLTVTGRDPGGEIVTAGGVALSEVEPRTMESRLSPGLYFCGEVLDIDGFTGGYNLQAAWSTGFMAGLAAGGGKEYP